MERFPGKKTRVTLPWNYSINHPHLIISWLWWVMTLMLRVYTDVYNCVYIYTHIHVFIYLLIYVVYIYNYIYIYVYISWYIYLSIYFPNIYLLCVFPMMTFPFCLELQYPMKSPPSKRRRFPEEFMALGAPNLEELLGATFSGWWFGTFFIFPYIGNNHPNWLSYFSEGWPNHQPVLYLTMDWFVRENLHREGRGVLRCQCSLKPMHWIDETTGIETHID